MDLNPNICICIHFHTYVIDIKIKIYIYKLIWFRTGNQSAFRESFGSERGFKARFASHLIQNGDSKRVSRVIWFRTGLFKARFASQFGSAERKSFGSVRDFRAQIIWFSSGLQSANYLVQFGTSERRAQII